MSTIPSSFFRDARARQGLRHDKPSMAHSDQRLIKPRSQATRNAIPSKHNTPVKSSTPASSKKRKILCLEDEVYSNPTVPASSAVQSSPTKATSKKKKSEPEEEKRLKRFRKSPPQSFLEKLQRAETQRMIVISRVRTSTPTSLSEEISVVGSTGNIYVVTISTVPSCTCPDSRKGNECKHKVYALHTVLKAPHHLQYQLAFLKSELDEIFTYAPPIPTDVGADSSKGHDNRKPIEGECPICYMDLVDPAGSDENELVWCKAACGNNMHKSCFEQWAKSQRGQTVKCVYCRTPWEMEGGELESMIKEGVVGEDGYVNVAEQFGMSRARDYTSYHQPWVRRQFGMGW